MKIFKKCRLAVQNLHDLNRSMIDTIESPQSLMDLQKFVDEFEHVPNDRCNMFIEFLIIIEDDIETFKYSQRVFKILSTSSEETNDVYQAFIEKYAMRTAIVTKLLDTKKMFKSDIKKVTK